MAAKTTVKEVSFEDGWPVDAEGNPLVKISFATAELVPTGNFANVTVGPAQATKFVAVADKESLAREISDLAEPVEWALGHRRDQILKELSEA